MNRCRKCGTQYEGHFCPRCGTVNEKPKSNIWVIVLCILTGLIVVFAAGTVILKQMNKDARNSEGSYTKELSDSETGFYIKDIEPNGTLEGEALEKNADDIEKAESNENASDATNEKNALAGLNKAEVERSLMQIDLDMSNYIWVALMDEVDFNTNFSEENSISVNLSDAERMRAAVLATETDGVIDSTFVSRNGRMEIDNSADYGPMGDAFHGMSVSKEKVEQNYRNMFGAEPDWNKLQTINKSTVYDAVKYSDGKEDYAIKLSIDVDTETDQESHEYRIVSDGNNLTGEVDTFWGYWGDLQNNPGYSNYTVVYGLEPSNISEYGVVITSITINKIWDTSTGQIDQGELPTSGFYGIWCAASKDESDARQVADKLTSAGLHGKVFVTTDWSGLNKEKWYVTSAGVYQTEAEANANLSAVKSAGYPNAYVKHSGNYLGE